jgi:hypothetical protein
LELFDRRIDDDDLAPNVEKRWVDKASEGPERPGASFRENVGLSDYVAATPTKV